MNQITNNYHYEYSQTLNKNNRKLSDSESIKNALDQLIKHAIVYEEAKRKLNVLS